MATAFSARAIQSGSGWPVLQSSVTNMQASAADARAAVVRAAVSSEVDGRLGLNVRGVSIEPRISSYVSTSRTCRRLCNSSNLRCGRPLTAARRREGVRSPRISSAAATRSDGSRPG